MKTDKDNNKTCSDINVVKKDMKINPLHDLSISTKNEKIKNKPTKRAWITKLIRKFLSWINKDNRFYKSTLFQVFNSLVRRDDVNEGPQCDEIDDNHKFMFSIIFDGPMLWKEYKQKFKRTHRWFSYMFFKPLIMIGNKLLGKFLVKQIYDAPYNKNFLVFNKVIEKSLHDWAMVYKWSESGFKDKKKYLEFCNNTNNYEIIRGLKRWLITMCQADSAYRVLFDLVMYNIAIEMNNAHPEKVNHLIYNRSTINDIHFFKIKGTLRKKHLIRTQNKDEYLVVDNTNSVLVKKEDLPEFIDKEVENGKKV